jgi:flagellar biosynthesis chaperone FliJ
MTNDQLLMNNDRGEENAMSCEAVLMPAKASTENDWDTLGGWAISAASVTALLAQYKRIAEAKMRKEKISLSAWQDYFKQQQEEMEQLRRFRAAIRTELRALHLTPLIIPRPQRVRAQGLRQKATPAHEQLNGIIKLLEHLSSSGVDEADSALPRLQQQTEYFIKQLDSVTPPATDVMADFFETVQRTVDVYLESLVEHENNQKLVLKQTEILLDNIMTYQHLTDNQAQNQSLNTLQQHLLAPGTMTAEVLALFEEKYGLLKTSIDDKLQYTAIQTSLIQSLHQHLTKMGYSLLEEVTESLTVWGIPGGEQVSTQLQARYQIAFQMRHERDSYREERLSDEELAFFRQQEGRWRDDLRELLRRLETDGFSYRLKLGRKSQHIPIVVAEQNTVNCEL